MTPEESAEAGIALLKLLAELVASDDWPGCAGVKVWNDARKKMVYENCGKCAWCKAEELVSALSKVEMPNVT